LTLAALPPRALADVAQHPSLPKTSARQIDSDLSARARARLINRAQPEGKFRIIPQIKVAATVIKAATTLISTRIGTNRTPCLHLSMEDYSSFSLSWFLSPEESVNHANTVAGTAGERLSVTSHVLHKVMTCTFPLWGASERAVSSSPIQFLRVNVARRKHREKERERERAMLSGRSHALGISRKINGNNGDTHGSVRF